MLRYPQEVDQVVNVHGKTPNQLFVEIMNFTRGHIAGDEKPSFF